MNICSLNKGKLLILSFYFLIISSLDIVGIALLGSFVTLILTPEYLENISQILNNLNLSIDLDNLNFFLGIGVILVFILKTIVALISYKNN